MTPPREETIENPYRPAPGTSPPFLAGRSAELYAIATSLDLTRRGAAASPVIFTGRKGVGKTAILRAGVAEAIKRRAIVLTAEASRDESLLISFASSLERAQRESEGLTWPLREALDAARKICLTYESPTGLGSIELGMKFEPQHATTLRKAIFDLNETARRHKRFLVVAIDELDECSVPELRALATLVHQSADKTSPILLLGAGRHELREHLQEARAYSERYYWFSLGLLERDDARAAIQIPAERADVRIEQDALDKLVDASAGYPYFIQRYGASAWNRRETAWNISLTDVERSIPIVQRSIEANLYDEPFSTLSPLQYRYVLSLAALGPGPHPVKAIAAEMGSTSEETSSTRNHLLRKNIVFCPAGGTLEFSIPFSEAYVKAREQLFEERAAPLTFAQWTNKAVARAEDLLGKRTSRRGLYTDADKFEGKVLDIVGPFAVVGNRHSYFQLYELEKLYKPVECGETAFFVRVKDGRIVARPVHEQVHGKRHLRAVGDDLER